MSRGLASRTRIIEVMEKGKNRVPEISEKAGLSSSCVGYHLRLLQRRRVVTVAQAGRENRWSLTKYGQERLFT